MKYALLIAACKFDYKESFPELRAPLNDVTVLSAILKDVDVGGFVIDSLHVDENSYEITKSIEKLIRTALRDDVVFIYYSGHGRLDENNQLCLVTKDTSAHTPDSTSIPFQKISGWVRNSKCRKITVVLDCCYSGAAGFELNKSDSQSALRANQLGSGIYLLTASTGVQISREAEKGDFSVFTQYLIEGINSGLAGNEEGVNADSLYEYIHWRMKRSNSKGQIPTKFASDARGDYFLFKSRKYKAEWATLLITHVRDRINDVEFQTVISEWLAKCSVENAQEWSELDRRIANILERWYRETISDRDLIAFWKGIHDLKAKKLLNDSVAIEAITPKTTTLLRVWNKHKTHIYTFAAVLAICVVIVYFRSVYLKAKYDALMNHAETELKLRRWESARKAFLVAESVRSPSSPSERSRLIRGKAKAIGGPASDVQKLESENLKLPVELILEVGHHIEMNFVLIPGGTFNIGASDSDVEVSPAERPHHAVKVFTFYMCKHEITVQQFRAFVLNQGSVPYRTEAEVAGKANGLDSNLSYGDHTGLNWKSPGFDIKESSPVCAVSWNDACNFARWLETELKKSNLPFEAKVRLPFETEWEYACRAGTESAFNNNTDSLSVDEANIENYPPKVGADDFGTKPVGLYPPNGFGLYDMHGNVFEWCLDAFEEDYYEKVGKPRESFRGPLQNKNGNNLKVLRGGAWGYNQNMCRSFSRDYGPSNSRNTNRGFRVVLEILNPE